MLTALIIDHTDNRRQSLRKALERKGVVVEQMCFLVRRSGNCRPENLIDCEDLLTRAQMVFIHVGAAHDEWCKTGHGNECAFEFLALNREALREKVVVAYSGAAKPPTNLDEVLCMPHHGFFGKLRSAEALNITGFLKAWRRCPESLPPIRRFRLPPSIVVGFLAQLADCHAAGADQMHSPNAWSDFVSDDSPTSNFAAAVNETGDADLRDVVTRLVEWHSQARLQAGACVFDAPLRTAIEDLLF